MSTDKLIFWDYTGTKLMPSVAKAWEVGDGGQHDHASRCARATSGRTAQPFTADDLVFWFEELYQNKDLTPTPRPRCRSTASPARSRRSTT